MWFLAFILLLASNSVGVTGSLSPLPSNVDKSAVVEGSGNDKLDSIRQVVGVDTEIHGSGNYGSDDEDSQLHQGSGDIVEGSGNVDGVREVVHEHPVVFMTTTTTTTHSPAIISETRHEIGVINEEHPSPILETPIKTITSEVPSETVPTTVPTTTSRRPPITAVPPAVNPGDSENTPFHHMLKPGIFAAVIGGMVVGLLTAILLVMFIVYRMRKKDEGSYALEEPKSRPYTGYAYTKASTKEFYA